jgi:hypothetical protein
MKKYDHLEVRCPRLGGEVTFSYCRQEGGDIPCLRVITCWHPFFPIEQYLKRNMTEDAWNSFVRRIPKDKIITIVELIEEAKKRAATKSE